MSLDKLFEEYRIIAKQDNPGEVRIYHSNALLYTIKEVRDHDRVSVCFGKSKIPHVVEMINNSFDKTIKFYMKQILINLIKNME